MKQNSIRERSTIVIVLGNEKGGAGKTTFSMHLIVGLLDKGYSVVSIDTDLRQKSLTTYVEYRKKYNISYVSHAVVMPEHHVIEEESKGNDLQETRLVSIINEHLGKKDYIVIDTPGSYTNLSKTAHSYADKVITPINDSFVDLDVIAKFEGGSLNMDKPSIYSETFDL